MSQLGLSPLLNVSMDMNIRRLLPISKVSKDECSSMDEYMSRRSLELYLIENRAAAMKLFAEDTRSRCARVSVEGYDTSLPADDIKVALITHFGLLCGDLCDVVVPIDPVTNLVNRCAFLYLGSSDAEKRALALNGSDVGGWNAIIQSSPEERECFIDPDVVVALRTIYFRKGRSTAISVEGYDTSLPLDDVKNALIKHFCSCGVITELYLDEDPRTNTLHSSAFLSFNGQDAVEKALALSGSDVGGWNVVAEPLPEPSRDCGPEPLGRYHG